jgi:hypothetical protein
MFPKSRNALLGAALCVVFGILLFAKLSVIQAYVFAACFFALAAYAIVLGFRD